MFWTSLKCILIFFLTGCFNLPAHSIGVLSIKGVQRGVSEKQVIGLLGRPNRQDTQNASLTTWIYFGKVGLVIQFVSGKAEVISGTELALDSDVVARKGDSLAKLAVLEKRGYLNRLSTGRYQAGQDLLVVERLPSGKISSFELRPAIK